jgi:carboxypeptidase PM20D1
LLGATDSRFFRSIADDVYRFAPFRVTPDDMTRIHGTGERVRLDDAAGAVAFYRTLIVRAGGLA